MAVAYSMASGGIGGNQYRQVIKHQSKATRAWRAAPRQRTRGAHGSRLAGSSRISALAAAARYSDDISGKIAAGAHNEASGSDGSATSSGEHGNKTVPRWHHGARGGAALSLGSVNIGWRRAAR